jgi:acetyltransferase-like isoleucine patch superfamily enzyme
MIRNIVNVVKARRRWRSCIIPFSVNINVSDWGSVVIGRNVVFGAFGDICVHAKTKMSSVAGALNVGSNCYVGSFVNIRAVGGLVAIGDHVQIAQQVSIIAANHIIAQRGQEVMRESLCVDRTGVVIGDHVWIGCNSVILPGVVIGCGAVIGAGSVVTKSIPSFEVWAGNPARCIRRLN